MEERRQLCGPCLIGNREEEGVVYCRDCGESLCDSCKQDHARFRSLKDHKFCDLADVPPQEIQGILKSLIACPKHENEEVVYLCKDHDVTCCDKCVTAYHRKCKEVNLLSDKLNAIKGDCSELKTVFFTLQQQGKSFLEQECKHEELISESENKALSWLKTTRQKLYAIYEQLEKDLLSDIAGRKKLIGEQIQAQKEKVQHFLQDIKLQSDLIESVEKFGTNEHVVLLQRKLEKDSVGRLKSTAIKLKANRSQSLFHGTVDTRFDSWLTEMRNCVRIEDLYNGTDEATASIDRLIPNHFR